MMTFFYYLNISIVEVFKHISAQFLGITLLFDIIYNWPFRHPGVSKFYISATVFFETAMTLCAIWVFSDYSDRVFFYHQLIITALVSGGFIAIWDYKYNKIMSLNHKNFKNVYKHLDFFLEEIYRLTLESEKNGTMKFKLISILKNHQRECIDKICICHETSFIDNDSEFEHISLKYISFLSKILENPFNAYFELKGILAKRKGISNYFYQISKIIGQIIERQIELKSLQSPDYLINEIQDELNLYAIRQIENLKDKYFPQFITYLEAKSEMWEKLRKGIASFDQIQEQGLILAQKGLQIKMDFEKELKMCENKHFQKIVVFFKLLSIYQICMFNKISGAFKMEKQAFELIKQDISKAKNVVTNYMLLQANLDTMKISLCKDHGKIISEKNQKQANIFNYNYNVYKTINKINQLMPPFIAKIHDEFIMNMMSEQPEEYILINQLGQIVGISEQIYYSLFTVMKSQFDKFEVQQSLSKKYKKKGSIRSQVTSKASKSSQKISNNQHYKSKQSKSSKNSNRNKISFKGSDTNSNMFLDLNDLNKTYIHLFMPGIVNQIADNLSYYDKNNKYGVIFQNKQTNFNINQLFSSISQSFNDEKEENGIDDVNLFDLKDQQFIKQFFKENKKTFQIQPFLQKMMLTYSLSYVIYNYGENQDKNYQLFTLEIKEAQSEMVGSQNENQDKTRKTFDYTETHIANTQNMTSNINEDEVMNKQENDVDFPNFENIKTDDANQQNILQSKYENLDKSGNFNNKLYQNNRQDTSEIIKAKKLLNLEYSLLEKQQQESNQQMLDHQNNHKIQFQGLKTKDFASSLSNSIENNIYNLEPNQKKNNELNISNIQQNIQTTEQGITNTEDIEKAVQENKNQQNENNEEDDDELNQLNDDQRMNSEESSLKLQEQLQHQQ
ncbi:hypothetical protein PPERSA_13091 [Pseudocohnilembus persalinus]|uniref:Transmembrane protein n=1 Tax=Pseudocohnilembus persalinus TaxID=266149 RepID=A0A0V0QWN9_PSEPJ|nr:hypothetical protein PPERSA_13091 [Pseudocohnilembus persalinus]|eukprot:KRX06612.1 hypothetical protein PPERSA_13091 [Pseudocohnilembus persalinus]